MGNSKVVLLYLFIFLQSFILLSCGYSWQGRGGALPGKPGSVCVLLFKNRSSYIGAETALANGLINELMRSTSVAVVDDTNRADATLQGEIISLTFGALSRTFDDSVYERTVTAVVSLKMKSRLGSVLYAVNRFAESDVYSVDKDNEDNEADESAKSEAVQKLFDRLSQRLVSQMTDNF